MSDPHIRRFLKAAVQRLAAAKVLLADDRYIDSSYLAGYVIECSLKALLLSYVPAPKRLTFIREKFRGVAAHSFEFLVHQLRRFGVTIPPEIFRQLQVADGIWSTDLRYEVGRGKASDCVYLCAAGRAIVLWVSRSVT